MIQEYHVFDSFCRGKPEFVAKWRFSVILLCVLVSLVATIAPVCAGGIAEHFHGVSDSDWGRATLNTLSSHKFEFGQIEPSPRIVFVNSPAGGSPWSTAGTATHDPIYCDVFFDLSHSNIQWEVYGAYSASGNITWNDFDYVVSISNSSGWTFAIVPEEEPGEYSLDFDYDDTQCRRTTLLGWIDGWDGGGFEYSIKIYKDYLLKFSDVFEDEGVDKGFSYVYVAPPGDYSAVITVVYDGQEFGGTYPFTVTNTGCIDSNITPIMTYPTYGPTWTPSYPTHGPTARPTQFIPIGSGTLPVPVPSGPWIPNPNSTPIFPIAPIIEIINTTEDLPPNLTSIWKPPDREDFYNIVNSSIISDESLGAVFDLWDELLSPIVTAISYLIALISIPFDLLTYINLSIVGLLDGMFTTLFAVIRPAAFFLTWIFAVIPDPLMWLGMCALGLVVFAKVLNS